MATEIEILRVLKIMGDVFPTFKLSSSAIEVYVRLLSDIPSPVLEKSALDHISRSTFFPSIAELRSAAFSILEAIDPTPSEYEAWSDVQEQFSRMGHSSHPEFANPVTTEVVRLLGWCNLCLSENPIADRAHFIQAYRAIAEQRHNSSYRPQIVKEFISRMTKTNPAELTSGEQEPG